MMDQLSCVVSKFGKINPFRKFSVFKTRFKRNGLSRGRRVSKRLCCWRNRSQWNARSCWSSVAREHGTFSIRFQITNTGGLVITPRQSVAITPSSRKNLSGNKFYKTKYSKIFRILQKVIFAETRFHCTRKFFEFSKGHFRGFDFYNTKFSKLKREWLL